MLLADQDAVGVEGLVSSFGWTNNEVIDLICIYLIHGLWILVFLFWALLFTFMDCFVTVPFYLSFLPSCFSCPLSPFFLFFIIPSLFLSFSLSLVSLSPSLSLSLFLSSKRSNMMCRSLTGFYLMPLSLL